MAKRWSLNEDYIVCKYCVENRWAFTSDVDIEAMQSKLKKAGFSDRSARAIKIRARDYDYLTGGYVESPSMTNREREVLDLVYNGMQLSHCIDEYVEEIYQPNDSVDISYTFDHKDTDMYQYLSIGELEVKPTFYATLDELLKKYYAKHAKDGKTIGAVKKYFKDSLTTTYGVSIDTFNSIRREKYDTVSRKNIFKLCFALELDYEDAKRFLASIGMEFRHNKKEEVVYEAILKCDSTRRFIISEIDDTLERNGCKPLFC
jgi:DNA-binding Xre family transcriptional regulator